MAHDLEHQVIQDHIKSMRNNLETKIKTTLKVVAVEVEPFQVLSRVDNDFRITSEWKGVVRFKTKGCDLWVTCMDTRARLPQVASNLFDEVEEIIEQEKYR